MSQTRIKARTKAIFPGSFDPITLGHQDIVERLSLVFPEVLVLVADSTSKNYWFSTEERVQLVKQVVGHIKNVKVESFKGLTVDFVESHSPAVLVRSLRGAGDLDYEKVLADANRLLSPSVETIFMLSRHPFTGIASSLVKEISKNGGSLKKFVPPVVERALKLKSQSRA